MMRVGIIDYGVGNLRSVIQALEELRVTPVLIDRPIDLRSTDSLILPGVGSFAECKNRLDVAGWTSALRDEVIGHNKPLLGICLGMQLLADNSSEGATQNQLIPGLGFIPGQVRHLRSFNCRLRIPHIGWNSITRANSDNHLFDGIPNGTDFYFVHSYAFAALDNTNVLATTDYGVQICAAVRRDHIWGVQFHPEKSSRAGFRLLNNFIAGPEC